ncbi:hypothetical protein [Hydrogenophaga sp. ANAO-22]|uniref:hypothetical protein n=1 Tax=Hydrogenophaga sp. ANAO-22 TaxID=3166645 RepID=UPI0036D40949
MLNISSTTAVSWPTPVSTAVAPVSPVAAVQPVQAGGNDGKAQTGFGREGRTATPSQAAAAARAGVDGRAAATDDDAAAALPASRSASGVPAAPQDVAAQRQAQQEAAQVAEQRQAKDKKAVEHLQNVLSRMWEASAAVVDRALGIEPAKGGSEVPGNQSDTAPDLSAVTASMIPRKPLTADRPDQPAMEQLPWPVMPEGGEVAEAVELDVVGDGVGPEAMAELVAYDEHGHGSAAPVEAGTLLSERV